MADDPNKVQKFFKIWWLALIQLMILEKMRSYLWKMELGFWTDALMHLLGHVAQIRFVNHSPWGHGIFWDFVILLDSSYILVGENEVLFVKIGVRVLFRTYGFILLLNPRRKITFYSLLIGFFHKLISD